MASKVIPDSTVVLVESLYREGVTLPEHDVEKIKNIILKIEKVIDVDSISSSELLYKGLLFIQRSSIMIFDSETEYLFNYIYGRLDEFEPSNRVYVNRAINYYLIRTNRHSQFLEFHKNVFKKDLLNCKDKVFKICNFFVSTWNMSSDNPQHIKLKKEYEDIGFALYKDYNSINQNDTLDAYYYFHLAQNNNDSLFSIKVSVYKKAYFAGLKIGFLSFSSYQAYEIGRLYSSQRKYEEARSFFFKALDYSLYFDQRNGYYQMDIGNTYEEEGNYEMAIQFYLKAYEEFVKGACLSEGDIVKNDFDKYFYVLDHLTISYLKLGNPMDALKYFYLSKDLRKVFYLEGYNDFTYFYDRLNSEDSSGVYLENKEIVSSFFAEHDINEKYPDLTPELLYADSNLLETYQINAISQLAKKNDKNYYVKNRNRFYMAGFIILIGFIIRFFYKVYANYKKTKKGVGELWLEYEDFKNEHLKTVYELEEINSKLDNLNSKEMSKFFSVPNKSKTLLRVHEIQCVESLRQHVVIHTTKGMKIKVWNDLKFYIENLPKSAFVRIQKSFLVNLYEIKAIVGDKIELKNGKLITIGKSYTKNLYNQFFNLEMKLNREKK